MGLGLIVAAACRSRSRHRPFLMLFLVCVAEVTLASTGRNPSLLWLVSLVLVYTIAVGRGLAPAWRSGAGPHRSRPVVGGGRRARRARRVERPLLMTVFTACLWIAGRSVRLRRAYQAELRDRARRVARPGGRHPGGQAEERSRIARELHDVVAHHVSVMTVQAAAARRVLASNPEGREEALSAIEELGRTAMSEMRSMVGVLRTGRDTRRAQPAAGGARDPDPGRPDARGGVADAAEHRGRAGRRGRRAAGALPARVDLAAYRRPGGPDQQPAARGPEARAWVTVRPRTGRAGRPGRGRRPRPGGARRGRGGEVVRARTGGHPRACRPLWWALRIGPRPGGGFEVKARFPLKDDG